MFASTTRFGLTQALGAENSFGSRARRKHLRARACSSVSDLVSCDCGIRSSPSGLSLRQVPAGRIARSCVHPHRPRPILLRQAGRALRFRPCGNQVLSGNLPPNNSFKPSPLRGLGAKPVRLGRAGLTQALGLQEQSQHSPGRAQATAATCITQQPLRGQSEKSSPASNCKQLSLWHQGQDQDLQLANAGRARASATRRTACPTS